MHTTARLTLMLSAVALAAASLSGCTVTTNTCTNGQCSVTLQGVGAETEIGAGDVEVTFAGSDGTTATFSVDGASASCAEGETVAAGSRSVTCDRVTADRLELSLTL